MHAHNNIIIHHYQDMIAAYLNHELVYVSMYIYNYNKAQVIRLVDTLQMIFFKFISRRSWIHDEKTHGKKNKVKTMSEPGR